jgi:hypothetical protein
MCPVAHAQSAQTPSTRPTFAGSPKTNATACPATDLARSPERIVEAWRLVYRVYRHVGHIHPNDQAIHTSENAVRDETAVFVGLEHQQVVRTLTAIADGSIGLPLDHVYPQELTRLRRRNGKLMELGLFVDAQPATRSAFRGLFDLLRYAFYYGLYQGVSDFVIGVHPHHVGFYQRGYGFDPIGPASEHPHVRSRPVVLLHARVPNVLARGLRYRGIMAMLGSPLASGCFEQRPRLTDRWVDHSPIGQYLREHQAQSADRPADRAA